MKQLLKRMRGVVGMGLIWAAGGAGVGMLIELLANVLPGGLPMASAVDIWPALLAIVGFLGGAVFSTVLGIVEGRRSFDELSLPRFATWGALAGLLLGGFMMAMGAPAIFIGITTLGSAIAASGSLVLARMAERRELRDGGPSVSDVGPGESEARKRLGATR